MRAYSAAEEVLDSEPEALASEDTEESDALEVLSSCETVEEVLPAELLVELVLSPLQAAMVKAIVKTRIAARIFFIICFPFE